MKKPVDVEKYKESYLQFVAHRNNVVLSMIGDEGKPFISITPFVKKDGKFYIYISQIADHYRLLENNAYIDAMIIADESSTNNKFGTERARFQCVPKNIGNEGHDDIFAMFDEGHGAAMMGVLRGLDFSLFELTPEQGRYVVGFGLAFDLDVDATVFNHVVVDKKKETADK